MNYDHWKATDLADYDPPTTRACCDYCGGEGMREHGHPNAPHADWVERCPVCGGAGFEEVEVEPLTEDDLDEAFPPPAEGRPTPPLNPLIGGV